MERWQPASCTSDLGDAEDCNEVSGQWYNEWPLAAWGDSPIFRWLIETFLPTFVNIPAEYPEPEDDDTSRETFLPDDRNENAMPCVPRPQKAV